jgi:hypothetical protein
MKVGLLGLMFLIMFALKLAGPMATVSWWVITLPVYGPLALLVIFGLIYTLGTFGLKGK